MTLTIFFHKAKRFVLRSGPAYEYDLFGDTDTDADLQKSERVAGWHQGARLCFGGALCCLIIEVVLLVGFIIRDHKVTGHGVIFEGSCQKVKHLNVLLLVPLNVVGTFLISGSNYVMQCLNAPSRREVDKAHANGAYLNIGVPSITNVRYLGFKKTVIWGVLGLFTIPIHLLLNSAVFASLQSNNYGVLVVDTGYEDDPTWRLCQSSELSDAPLTFACTLLNHATGVNVTSNRREPEDCIRLYLNTLGSSTSNVMLVTKNTTQSRWSLFATPTIDSDHFSACNHTCYDNLPGMLNVSLVLSTADVAWNISSILGVWDALDYKYMTSLQYSKFDFSGPDMRTANRWEPDAWLCDTGTTGPLQPCVLGDVAETAADWRITPNSLQIDHCWVEPEAPEYCRLYYSTAIMAVVIACDVVKTCCIAFVIRLSKCNRKSHQVVLATLGDAIESFLDRADETSADRSLIDQKRVRSMLGTGIYWMDDGDYFESLPLEERVAECPRVFGPQPITFQAERHRLLERPSRSRWLATGPIFGLIVVAASAVLGIGMVNLRSLGVSDIWSRGIGTIDPNAIFTTTAIDPIYARLYDGAETGRMFRLILMINTPQLLVSMLYFLYNGLLTSMMCAYEFSKFSLQPTTLREGVVQNFRDITACGFSPLAILLFLVILFVLVAVLIAVGSKHLPAGVPLVGTCSWAISAACHDIGGEKDAAIKPLMWGEIASSDPDGFGHCSISSRTVVQPTEGRTYA
ncbi:hypothetical protein A1O3_08035 [Capronia epimyces CBS 606.96]|uniref:DUF6536 domain-containing protein n=1 Tax=Capronia epimyces CBS 606.96 TaxID=1182542 RepID=W9XGV8_9EURO|nr:uncharacterized protein A1O3_08035 [Capronia epimyces CBS 606.96]EXJ79752.1 hypothetical protein A1O3_08035 [Capronia epimyces CBS 606.96]